METREIDRDELKGGGFLALPDGNGPHPGVVVIHEAYGLNDNIKGIARRLATAGYIKIYPGARHSFFNEHSRAFNRGAADDSWSRVTSFFGRQLARKES